VDPNFNDTNSKHLCSQQVVNHEVFDLCHGVDPMIMEICYTIPNDDMEFVYRWAKAEVKFCPFCGLKSEVT